MESHSFSSQSKNVVTITLLGLILLSSLQSTESSDKGNGPISYKGLHCRKHTGVLTDFGGVGDGKTSNTKAFKTAVANLSQYADDGGAILVVPPGKYVTGSFNITSHFTLYLSEGATLLGSTDLSEWPELPILPSYGRGRDAKGRLSSLIWGTNLTDVVITGGNATIDGQGDFWWHKWKKLKVNRPYLIELMYSKEIQISNLTLINAPTWNIHPTYSSDIIIQHITIFAPVTSPNTDGINPDSCSNVLIEDCYIVSGDDCIAVKSGWDEYGIKFNMPTQDLKIKNLICISPDSAAVALGSEMSGGIKNVRVEDLTAINTEAAIRIKTGRGRGAYVKDIFARRMTLKTMKYVFWMTGNYGSHPDNKFDPNAIPDVHGVNYKDIVAENVSKSARLEGIEGYPFKGICISNATLGLSAKPKKVQWLCTDVEGVTSGVSPPACDSLPEKKDVVCEYPEDKLPIEGVELESCTVSF